MVVVIERQYKDIAYPANRKPSLFTECTIKLYRSKVARLPRDQLLPRLLKLEKEQHGRDGHGNSECDLYRSKRNHMVTSVSLYLRAGGLYPSEDGGGALVEAPPAALLAASRSLQLIAGGFADAGGAAPAEPLVAGGAAGAEGAGPDVERSAHLLLGFQTPPAAGEAAEGVAVRAGAAAVAGDSVRAGAAGLSA
jgi:hypothetical protein